MHRQNRDQHVWPITKQWDQSYLGTPILFNFSANLKLFNIKWLRKVSSWIMSVLRRQRQEAQKFKVILGYITSLRPAWDMWDPVKEEGVGWWERGAMLERIHVHRPWLRIVTAGKRKLKAGLLQSLHLVATAAQTRGSQTRRPEATSGSQSKENSPLFLHDHHLSLSKGDTVRCPLRKVGPLGLQGNHFWIPQFSVLLIQLTKSLPFST